MKKKILRLTLFLLLILSVTIGCKAVTLPDASSPETTPQVTDTSGADISEEPADTTAQEAQQDQNNKDISENSNSNEEIETTGISDDGEKEDTSADKPETLDENGSYTTKDDVALYLYTYGKLPDNFITKNDAKALGWEGGSLESFAPGKCIGGDRFGNYEGILPKDKSYHECDIDTLGQKSRGAKRIVFSDDGYIYYTDDHYESFTLLYGGE